MNLSRGRETWHRALAFASIVACYSLVSVLFSWPTVRLDSSVFYTRQFDLYGVLWMIRHVREVLFDGVVTATNFPLGENATRPDAYVLALVALGAGDKVSPLAIVRLFVLAGPVAGALAAEHCAARGFGVRRPWSLLAGLAYGFNGLAATAWLEGHVYFLFDPWLPLLLLSLVRLTRSAAPRTEGVKAGCYWILALATSGYIGIFASLLVAIMLVRGVIAQVDRRRALRTAAVPLLIFLPFGILYAWVFFGGTGQVAPDLWRASTSGAASIARLTSWWPGVDGKTYHSIATPLGFVTVSLGAFAPIVLARHRGWRTLLGTAAAAVLVSFGPVISPGLGAGGGVPAPMVLFAGTPVMTFLHFPVRFLWLAYLCGGIVAARSADEIARRVGFLPGLPLLAMAIVDSIALTGAPFRAEPVLAGIPSAYKAVPAGMAVLDLFGEQPVALGEIGVRVTKLTTYYQTVHGRPVLAAALPTYGKNCRDRIAARVVCRLLDWKPGATAGAQADVVDLEALLAELGIGAVAVHSDLFAPDDLAPILDGLRTALGPPAAVSRDGGETVVLFLVRKHPNADPLARYRKLLEAVPETGSRPGDQ